MIPMPRPPISPRSTTCPFMRLESALQVPERPHEQQADRAADQAQRHGVDQVHQPGRVGRELVQRLEEGPAQQDEDHRRHGRGQQAGEQHPEIGRLAAAGPPCADSRPRIAPLNGEVINAASMPLTPE